MFSEEDAPLDLFCHGSEKGQPSTFVNISGVDTGESKVALTCVGGVFKRLLFEVMPIILLHLFISIYLQTTVSVESASCNRKQEPLLMRRAEQCSPVGADGRDDGGVVCLQTYIALLRV